MIADAPLVNPGYVRDGRAPTPKSQRVSRAMSAIGAKNTKPELAVRRLLTTEGIRGYRLHWKRVGGRPDIAFPGKKVAVFVHGCFWHGCPYCKLKLPKTHREFWKKKIETNKARDARKVRELRRLGWRTVTVWACRLKTERGRNGTVKRIAAAIA